MLEKPVLAVIGGSGAEGSGLALRWAKAGYRVLLGSRGLDKAIAKASELNTRLGNDQIVGMINGEAAANAEVVVLTVPYSAQLSTLCELKTSLVDKILIDVTAPLVPPKVSRVQLPAGGSATVIAQNELGPDVRVVAAFQNVSAHHLLDLNHDVDCDVMVFGDDKDAREAVIALAQAIGLRGLHAGTLANSAAAEALTSVLIFMNRHYKSPGTGIRITGLSELNDKASSADRVSLIALTGIPTVQRGDDLAQLVLRGLVRIGERLTDGDVIVLAQKIVSKSQGRLVRLDSITPSPRAIDLSSKCQKDPRLVELILSESTEVLRVKPGVIVVAHRLGIVLANAGIDRSNVAEDDTVLLLPHDPDRAARDLRTKLREATGTDVGVIINDSLGRAWRNGTIGTALAVSGLPALADLRGHPDMFGRALQTTEVGYADEVAAAASLLMGQADQRRPIVLVRGLTYDRRSGSAADLIRDRKLDMFR